jgi:hypothetical protein
MLVGAITGAAVAGLSHGIEYLVTGQTSFSAARLGISILAGALGGGIVGRVKWAKAQNQTAGNVNRPGGNAFDASSRSSYAPSEPRSSLSSLRSGRGQFNNQPPLRQSIPAAPVADVVKQSDPAGVRAWMRNSSVIDDLVEAGGSSRTSSVSSGYSLRTELRVSQQLNRMSFGSLDNF